MARALHLKSVRIAAIATAIVLVGSAAVFAVADDGAIDAPIETMDSFVARHPTQVEAEQPGNDPPEEPNSEPEITTPAGSDDCLNSFDSACGPFHWIEEPSANKPIHISIETTPTNPVVGDEVTVTVKAWDGDAPFIGSWLTNVTWGETGIALGHAVGCGPSPQGAWTPPTPTPGSQTFTYKHIYERPGTFRLTFDAFSWSSEPWGEASCHYPESDPYGSEDSDWIVITVTPGPEPTPTTAPTVTSSPSPTASPTS